MAGKVVYTVREARWSDCGALSRKICEGRWLAYRAAGIDPKRKLRELWGLSMIRRTCLIEGRIVAMWGLLGSLLSRSGYLWMAVSPEAVAHPASLVYEVKKQIAEFSEVKPELIAMVSAQDSIALRFAAKLGFIEMSGPGDVDGSGAMVVTMRRPGSVGG